MTDFAALMPYARGVAREHIAWGLNHGKSVQQMCVDVGYPNLVGRPFVQIIEEFAALWLNVRDDIELSKAA